MTKNKFTDIKKVPITHVTVKSDASQEDHLTVHEKNITGPTEPASTTVEMPPKSRVHDALPDISSIPLTEFLGAKNDAKPPKMPDTDQSAQTTDPTNTSSITTTTDPLLHTPEDHSDEKSCQRGAKTIFMGTGDLAGHVLSEMLKHHACDVVAIVTQPDKKLGRKKSGISRSLAPNPVRDIAITHKLPLLQPVKFDAEAIAALHRIAPDLLIVVSYGKILPKAVLDLPKVAAVNIHTSLLPKLRGASPIQNALLLGLKETGITIMMMDEGVDTGDIIAQVTVPIDAHEKSSELTQKLSRIGAKLFIDTYPKILSKSITTTPQDHSQATLCQMIDREDGHIQWTDTTEEIYNRYRALYPWPGIFGYWEIVENQMMRVKLRGIYPYSEELTDEQKDLQPGTVFIARDQLCIKTFDTAIILEAIQPECKAVMPVYDFLNGYKEFEGAVLR